MLALRLLRSPSMENKSEMHPKVKNMAKLIIISLLLQCTAYSMTGDKEASQACIHLMTYLQQEYLQPDESMNTLVNSYISMYAIDIESILDREDELLRLITECDSFGCFLNLHDKTESTD